MSQINKKRGTLSSELAKALTRLAVKAPVFTVDEFAQAMGRPKSKTWRILHFLAEGG